MPGADGARRRLRIAQVAPPFVRVPPARYGGTERVISALTEELVRRGHRVTLFAAGTSRTAASLRPSSPTPLWEVGSHQRRAYEVGQIEDVVELAEEFDVIHWHTECLQWLVTAGLGTPSVTTIHGHLQGEPIRKVLARHSRQPLISISDAQRRPVADLDLNWVETVHHGLELRQTYRLGTGAGGYLVFVGRSSPEKGLATAIRVAIRCGLPIKIAARIEPNDLPYHKAEVVPLLDHRLVEWIGEANDDQKAKLLEDALALLMPIDWEEPFGLAVVEALAAGTPVITRPLGSLPEIMRDGEHGLFAWDEDEFAKACRSVHTIDRAVCRAWALARFSAGRMADDYETVYARHLGESTANPIRAETTLDQK